ncbi:unnamed protein product [Fraxinus pennsylvanica]|uniref:protein-serine/threonine phosphatase n=1 Tax=Fraxinus pennsylvanica TaxID=56036 RepID=A0AAD1ZPD4_9LAMI|nr:unnamed protein product [Fraxinus pennsylvanica]
MAGMCCGVKIGESETAAPLEPSSKSARRKRMGCQQYNIVPSDTVVAPSLENGKKKRLKVEVVVPAASLQRECENSVENFQVEQEKPVSPSFTRIKTDVFTEFPEFGTTSVCGRRRDMEDAVAIHPSFCGQSDNIPSGIHFFGVYDGHGCSHVAMKCKDRMHEIVKDEVKSGETSWKELMFRSFSKMDQEVTKWSGEATYNCRCGLQTPWSDNVGSTAVVAVVTPEKIIVSNCGDSRAVLCRNGVAIPLSVDHKPDRPDELIRIEESGGRVIFWDGARVLGVLAMSRAIGDGYLKPYVISEPEVTITERMAEDECLILASDGLWDVVSNETACRVARMCLQSRKPPSLPRSSGNDIKVTDSGQSSDKSCSDASILLTKLALARHSTDNVSVVVVDLRRDL